MKITTHSEMLHNVETSTVPDVSKKVTVWGTVHISAWLLATHNDSHSWLFKLDDQLVHS